MKKVVLGLFVAAAFLMTAASAQAQVFKLSLWDKICVPNGDYTGGLELGIGSQTKAVDGVQLGIIYSQADKLQGVQLGIVNNTDDGTGVQWGLVNLAQDFTGIQYGGVNWTKGDFTGGQLGFVNVIQGTGTGAQLGFVNYANDITGLQWGFVNYADTAKGLQLGFVNWANNMNGGVQVGLVNIIKNAPHFLPVFVIFNFGF